VKRFLPSVILASLVFSLASPVRAQGTGHAEASSEFKSLMRKGITEYRKGNLEDARQALSEAWEIRQENDLAATLAEIEMKLGRFRDAANHWEYYIETLPPDRTEAEQRLAECRSRLGRVRVAAEPAGAAVFIDGREIGQAPLRSDVWLEPGEHTFESRLAGQTSPMKRLPVAPGDALVVALDHTKASATDTASTTTSVASTAKAPGAAPETDRGSGGISGATVALIAGSVLTATAAGIGIGFTLKVGAADDDVSDLRHRMANQPGAEGNSYCNPTPGTPVPTECKDLVDKLDERDSSRRIALGSFIGAGAIAVGTVVTYLLWPSEKAESAGSRRVVVLPFASAPGASVRVRF
jgi:hypothetical protein